MGRVTLARLSSVGAGKVRIGLHQPDCKLSVHHSFFDCINENSIRGICIHDDGIAVECIHSKLVNNVKYLKKLIVVEIVWD